MEDPLVISLQHVNRLGRAADEFELHSSVTRIMNRLAIDHYVYVWLTSNSEQTEIRKYRFLVGCNPEWMQIYQYRHWYMNDPLIAYAIENIRPVTGSTVVRSTAGQRELLAVASSFGMRSQLIVPTHTRASNTIGMLQVANGIRPEDGGEAALSANLPLLRALGAELMDWGLLSMQREAAAQFNLSVREIEVLDLVRSQESARSIAEYLNVSVRTVYGIYSEINQKMSVSRITDALEYALTHGLLNK